MDYVTKRSSLVVDPRFPWLESFRETLGSEIANELPPITHKIPRYDWYQVEDLINDVSRSLERCLVYRREYNELEGAAIKAALDYELFQNTLRSNQFLERADWIKKQRELENKAQLTAKAAFDQENSALPQGFSAISEGSAASTQVVLDNEPARLEAIDTKWQELSDYQDTLASAHSVPGHPLNFGDQADRAKAFFLDELKEAYEKARCVDKGIFTVYKFNPPVGLPDPFVKPEFFLDDLIIWLRSLIRDLELIKLKDIEFEHVISGHQPTVKRGGLVKDYVRAVSEPNWIEASQIHGSGKLEFDVDKHFDPQIGEIKLLRVKGIGLSMSVELGDPNRYARTSAIVFPPEVDSPFEAKKVPRTPIIIENICKTDPSQAVRFTSPPSVINLEPRGKWVVQMSTNIGFPDLDPRGRPRPMLDIKLHFLLSGQPEPNHARWSEFWW
jgi:hypothetical protein